ncbi:hypothetical protein CTI12_AA122220 [Artemisia annua]|uniref:Uncharacterized protein n=1 Tax=Artemisia annua TaxID=35608 RepID=A0A2U1PR52_ARTAN|nr:hypothetical protein CTI12_AA122220 [Artemisia annua]
MATNKLESDALFWELVIAYEDAELQGDKIIRADSNVVIAFRDENGFWREVVQTPELNKEPPNGDHKDITRKRDRDDDSTGANKFPNKHPAVTPTHVESSGAKN